ncbi:hypothetical protein [uncultured Porticoccus sp.]|nr:hypothetical protein [uncultured Porticoccus sp.]
MTENRRCFCALSNGASISPCWVLVELPLAAWPTRLQRMAD